MEKTDNEKEIFGYEKPFRYTAEWYTSGYRSDFTEDQFVDPGPGMYEARDRECIDAMEIKDGDRVLVSGCDKGNNISLVRTMYDGLKITGFDWSSSAIDFCRRVFPDCVFAVACVDAFEYTYGQFDRVLALDFTEHLSLLDYMNFLALCFNALRPGGTVGILPGLTKRPEHINLIYPMSIAQHLSQFGFKIAAVGQQWVVGEKR